MGFRLAQIFDMHNQGIETRPAFGGEDSRHRQGRDVSGDLGVDAAAGQEGRCSDRAQKRNDEGVKRDLHRLRSSSPISRNSLR